MIKNSYQVNSVEKLGNLALTQMKKVAAVVAAVAVAVAVIVAVAQVVHPQVCVKVLIVIESKCLKILII